METMKMVNCFSKLLLDYMKQGERGQAESFNAIKNGLNILINVSAQNGPLEEMSLIFAHLPEIRSVVNEKSDDFPNDALMLREAQENFEKFFDGELSDPKATKEFFAFIKEKKVILKEEIELRQNMTQLIHDQKENF